MIIVTAMLFFSIQHPGGLSREGSPMCSGGGAGLDTQIPSPHLVSFLFYCIEIATHSRYVRNILGSQHSFSNSVLPPMCGLGCFVRTKVVSTTGCFAPQLTIGPTSSTDLFIYLSIIIIFFFFTNFPRSKFPMSENYPKNSFQYAFQ